MHPVIRISRLLIQFVFGFAAVFSTANAATPQTVVGTARIDITPELPIRLAGYGSRQTEADRIERRLYARALALGTDDQKPVVLLTVESIGISGEISDAVAAALRRSHRLDRERLAICTTHTHTGPMLHGVLPFMFSQDLPPAEVARIAMYTESLRGKLVQAAAAALADRKPGRLAWAEGKAGFATQRRKIVDGKFAGFGLFPDGLADRALPILRVTDEQGGLRAVFLSYACHSTTLNGPDNFVHSDWPGDAAARIEGAHAGAVALVALGCAGDANPSPRGSLEQVARHGQEIATEVDRLLGAPMRPLGPVTAASYGQIQLQLDRAVTREELQQRVVKGGRRTAYAASKFIQQIDAGRPLPPTVPCPVQTWCFGGDLAMVFLGGEAVAEYSLRLRRELDSRRLWVNAYANGVPCYLASKRMYSEGGTEVDGSMDYYGWPTRLSIDTEDQVIRAVHQLLPFGFESRDRK